MSNNTEDELDRVRRAYHVMVTELSSACRGLEAQLEWDADVMALLPKTKDGVTVVPVESCVVYRVVDGVVHGSSGWINGYPVFGKEVVHCWNCFSSAEEALVSSLDA